MKLKEWRDDVGRSAAEVAEELGCTRQAVQKYEAGNVPNPVMLERIGTMTGGRVTPNDWFDVERWRAGQGPAPAVGAPLAQAA